MSMGCARGILWGACMQHAELFRCVDPPLAYPWESGNHTKRQFLWGGGNGLASPLVEEGVDAA